MPEKAISREIFERLQQATAGNPETLTELCRDYVAEARASISRLRAALAEGDAREFRERAHYLKGSSMMLGARDLSQCCAMLEEMARNGRLAEAENALQQATAALQAVEAELAERLGPVVLPVEGSVA